MQATANEPGCYLCPGNSRAGGVRNPGYDGTFVSIDDFAALLPGTPPARSEHPLLRFETEQGTCRVAGISAPPLPAHGSRRRWLGQATESDVRTLPRFKMD